MKLERLLIIIIIGGLAYISYTQYNSMTRIFNLKFLESVIFKRQAPEKEVFEAVNNRDEIKEIMELTKLIHEVETEVSVIYEQFDLIRINQNKLENPSYQGNRLLSDIKDLRESIGRDKLRIAELKNQVSSYKTSNSNLNQIKKQYIKMLDSKDRSISVLKERIDIIENELYTKSKVIEEQAKIISDQKSDIITQKGIIEKQYENIKSKQENIDYQERVIEELSVKHVILYARKETIHLELKSNSFYLQNKISQLEIISEHPATSFQMTELKEGVTEFIILNPTEFWNGNNYLLIAVKSRKLYY